MEKKRIALLGSTGSIGTQALQLIEEHPDRYSVEVLTAGNNSKLLIQQAKKFLPDSVVIANKELYKEVFDALNGLDIKVYAGEEALTQIVELSICDTVLLALVGFSGVKPALSAIRSGKKIALANKESLVAAGEILTKEAKAYHSVLLPVDSEHSAIFQCLEGEYRNEIEKLIITGSGGPFRGMTKEKLQHVTVAQALRHPTWNMGRKITVDSASLMNKGLEAIEAKWLFNVKPEQIELVIHPQSIIHSLVQFKDGAIKAQLGLSDMKLPIAYALSYPERLESRDKRFSFDNFSQFTFERPDWENFRSLALVFETMKQGGNMPCILNAANETAVYAFLEGKISFLAITEIIEQCLQKIDFIKNITIENIIETDRQTRILCDELIKNFKK
ncbi:MAG: 1-deoxy-D-xylulose-5-phosphate reductoisomerase [Bacteroidales bacterium]|jgi:1-deoxy-D-xylulose-5-phosphate reductoisomerase|nr:1-deoxy-D-xylulose-5-phosphate reductoisomerase [Bacteroidales bacterium]